MHAQLTNDPTFRSSTLICGDLDPPMIPLSFVEIAFVKFAIKMAVILLTAIKSKHMYNACVLSIELILT